ncbi:glycosyl hydrolase family 18 protein [Paenibacillus chibensis]|uniref:glycosyl hydrolase family 18 protein n=1 Tax=Paenibacillus chibensis TaxID=59846 RepID=UPI0013E368DA|nr:glycosyl hydrolase family 18 protein [Paenibacillus chibensis]MEC0371690.1 glycosyl hydrolase family 18 protein [Paenibacillus chibensis]
MIFSSFAVAGQASAGSSDTRGHWAEQLLTDWKDQGLLKGYPDGSIKPNQALTRAEWMAMINRYFHFTGHKDITFPDVKPGQWQYEEAAKALEAGYMTGYEDGSIHPDRIISREEAAVMLAKIVKAGTVNDAGLSRFKDAGSISAWGKQALAYLLEQGKLGGYEDGTLRPKTPLTRAEGVALISRLPAALAGVVTYDKAGTYGPGQGMDMVEGDAVIKASGVTLQNVMFHGNLVVDIGAGPGAITFKNVKVEGTLTIKAAGIVLEISGGSLGTVVIDGQGNTLQLGSDASISSLVLNALTQVKGKGKIQKATINDGAKGSSFETAPLSTDGPQASSIKVGAGGNGGTGSSGGSGSSGSGGGSGSGGDNGGGVDTTVPQAPVVTGVLNGTTYHAGVLPNWTDAPNTATSASLNGAAYVKGSGIIEAGSYELIVTAVHKASGKKASTTVKFTMEPQTKLIGYVAGWSNWSDMQPVDASKLTHINYAFTHIKDNKIIPLEGQNDDDNYAYLSGLKSQNPNLKILNSVGGWAADGFSDAALTGASRNTFADSIIDYVKKYHLDGIDLDWEYPTQEAGDTTGRAEDRENFTLLLKLIREKLNELGLENNKYYELTIAAGATKSYLDGVEIDQVAKYVDNINLMTYDFAGGWSTQTEHHTNLFGDGQSADHAVTLFSNSHVPTNKLVIGAAFYSHKWTKVQSAEHNGLGQGAEGSWETPVYTDILANYNADSDFVRYWDDNAKAPYLFDGSTFISYDDPQSMAEKAKYVLDHKLGGAMFWEYSQDASGSLLTALNDGLKGKKFEEDTTSIPDKPQIRVQDDGEYDFGFVPEWSDAPGTVSTAQLNGQPYVKGTAITAPGDYVLTLITVHGKSLKTKKTEVPFTVKKKGLKAIAYVPGWVDWSNAHPIDASKLTHINYAFTHIQDNRIIPLKGQNDDANYAYLRELRKENPHLKILNSVGGWAADGFSDAALTEESRETFAGSIIDYVKKYDLDGIDLDWEYPTQNAGDTTGRPEDKQNFSLLLKLLREKLNGLGLEKHRYYELTIAAGATQNYLNGVEIHEVVKYVDNINLMTYDFAGGWSAQTEHHTNLYGGSISVDSSVRLYLGSNVPADKLVIGAAFYGHLWTGVKSGDQHGLGQDATGTGVTPTFNDILAQYTADQGFTRYWDDTAKAPYLFDGSIFVSYDDEQSVSEKAKYVLDQQLAGAMFWEYSQDASGRLLTALANGLKGIPFEAPENAELPVIPDAPVISGVTDGETYASGISPEWADAADTQSSALLNGAAYIKGTPITTPGSYTLVVTAVHTKSQKTSNSTVHFTVKAAEPAPEQTPEEGIVPGGDSTASDGAASGGDDALPQGTP